MQRIKVIQSVVYSKNRYVGISTRIERYKKRRV
jgi:hypothetical protein